MRLVFQVGKKVRSHDECILGYGRFKKGLESIQKEIDIRHSKNMDTSLRLVRGKNHRFWSYLLMVFETIGMGFYPRKMKDKHFGMVSLRGKI